MIWNRNQKKNPESELEKCSGSGTPWVREVVCWMFCVLLYRLQWYTTFQLHLLPQSKGNDGAMLSTNSHFIGRGHDLGHTLYLISRGRHPAHSLSSMVQAVTWHTLSTACYRPWPGTLSTAWYRPWPGTLSLASILQVVTWHTLSLAWYRPWPGTLAVTCNAQGRT